MLKQLNKILTFGLVLIFSNAAYADPDFNLFGFGGGKAEVTPVTDKLYREECGSCHMPYQPGLLPERSWRQLLTAKALEEHFGESAELDETDRLHILKVAIAASADKSNAKRSRKIMASLSNSFTPERITDIAYIQRKHDELSSSIFGPNKEVKSLSQCEQCHQKADEGMYDEDYVKIPGASRWNWD